ncbi:hypothetical protein M9Y10_019508 [Tritrichomonas musculus]|uniref:Uncharacterized protein n=1 Tax=Tritrichomonas musculus TaxID=1915356 RepID=A0ABR2HGI4_9EUKA
MKVIQSHIIKIIEKGDDIEEEYENLKQIVLEDNFFDVRQVMISTLAIISNIIKNHRRNSDFFNKIKKIILIFETDIKKNFTNLEIFHIFKSHKIILLFMIKEKILTLNESIVKIITQDKYIIRKYPEYFYEEIKNYIDKEAINKFMPKEQFQEKYDDYRKDGENETYICEIIRKDMIEEFTTYISKTNYPLDSKI